MVQLAAADSTQKVSVWFGGKSIGAGTAAFTADAVNLEGSYQWPPEAPAEVRFAFDLKILTEDVCSVAVNWPGLLPEAIHDPAASYFSLLILARVELLITTHAGDSINFVYTGPPADPEITTGFQISVLEPGATSPAALAFRFVTG